MSTRDRLYDKRVTLYIPTRRMKDTYGTLIAEAAGGYTYIEQKGAWQSALGELVAEPVLVIQVLYNTVTNWRMPQVLEDIRKDLLLNGEQEVLMVFEAVNGVGYT